MWRHCLSPLFFIYLAVSEAQTTTVDQSSLSHLDSLSHTQSNLIQTIMAKERYENGKKVVKKRGFMKLVTELSRTDLAETARKVAMARAEAKG